jgi:hypothetical protein
LAETFSLFVIACFRVCFIFSSKSHASLDLTLLGFSFLLAKSSFNSGFISILRLQAA